MQSIYQQIGDNLSESVEVIWDVILVEIEAREDVILAKGTYIVDNVSKSLKIPRNVILIFKKMHDDMAKVENRKWVRAYYKLLKDMEFKLEFDY